MIKIGVLSDTHGHYGLMEKALDMMGEVQYVIHLGDYCSDSLRIKKKKQCEVVGVKGNCDFVSSDFPSEEILQIGGKRIFLTHGHIYHVKYGLQTLTYKGEEAEADLVLFGHTHHPSIFFAGRSIFMNPGSAGEPREGNLPSFGMVQITENKIVPYIINIK